MTTRPEPTERERAHVNQLFKAIDEALDRTKERGALYDKWRRAYAGFLGNESDGQARSNMIYAAIASTMPHVYAKDPDISFSPARAVDPKRYELIKRFAETGEAVVVRQFRDASLKRRAKACVRTAMTCGVGWWKVTFQEDRKTDPVVVNRINDIQDNLDRIRSLSADKDGALDERTQAQQAELAQQLAALQQLPEIVSARGTVIDAVLPEDMLILDRTVRNFDDYLRADRLAQRIWLSEDAFADTFGFAPEKATRYAELSTEPNKNPAAGSGFYQVFEVWDKTAGSVYTLARGEAGYVRAPYVPQKVGRRWYPFFALGFNLVDGRFEPLSDVELLLPLAKEYNETRDELVKHRKANVPVRLAKKGGNLTDEDAQRIQNRQTDDLIFVNGVPGRPLQEDLAMLEGAPINPAQYDTTPIRSDMEQIIGAGDAARGTVMKAKTATEAEIMAQGLRSRTEERQEAIEDMLADAAQYVFEVCLRELRPQEVERIAGAKAEWPQLSVDEALSLVNVEIRAGSSGKPNKLQEQDRWLTLLPIVEKAMMSVVEMRANGQADMADAITELLRETLRRFDERIDVDNFIPPAMDSADLEGMTPDQLKAALMQAQTVVQQLQEQLQQATDAEAAADRDVDRKLRLKAGEQEIEQGGLEPVVQELAGKVEAMAQMMGAR